MKNFITFMIGVVIHAVLWFLIVNEYLTAVTIIGFSFFGIAAIIACFYIGCFVYAMISKYDRLACERAIKTIEIKHPDYLIEFRKWAHMKGLTTGTYAQTVALAINWSEEDKTVTTPDEIIKGLNKRVLAYNNEEIEKALNVLD